MDLKGSKQNKKLDESFCGRVSGPESLYVPAAGRGLRGYLQISNLFLGDRRQREGPTPSSSSAAGKVGCLSSRASYPAGPVGSTAENLKAAAGGRNSPSGARCIRTSARSPKKKGSRRWPSSSARSRGREIPRAQVSQVARCGGGRHRSSTRRPRRGGSARSAVTFTESPGAPKVCPCAASRSRTSSSTASATDRDRVWAGMRPAR